ncbi:uncharacterized protein [Excalfactoria chinensis]|uniref:uncharacterized protein n=1 Tax=Excalfactoria chinensis TaxID=46218 RepID=UPI003B3B6732
MSHHLAVTLSQKRRCFAAPGARDSRREDAGGGEGGSCGCGRVAAAAARGSRSAAGASGALPSTAPRSAALPSALAFPSAPSRVSVRESPVPSPVVSLSVVSGRAARGAPLALCYSGKHRAVPDNRSSTFMYSESELLSKREHSNFNSAELLLKGWIYLCSYTGRFEKVSYIKEAIFILYCFSLEKNFTCRRVNTLKCATTRSYQITEQKSMTRAPERRWVTSTQSSLLNYCNQT